MNIIHTDIKVENVLLVNSSHTMLNAGNVSTRLPNSVDIRLIDFGSVILQVQFALHSLGHALFGILRFFTMS